jgi:hypothetical protein
MLLTYPGHPLSIPRDRPILERRGWGRRRHDETGPSEGGLTLTSAFLGLRPRPTAAGSISLLPVGDDRVRSLRSGFQLPGLQTRDPVALCATGRSCVGLRHISSRLYTLWSLSDLTPKVLSEPVSRLIYRLPP